MIKSRIEIQYIPGSGGEHLYWLLSMTGELEWSNRHKFENILSKKDFVEKIVYNNSRPYNWNKDREIHSYVYLNNISFIHDAGIWRLHCNGDWKIFRIVPDDIDLIYANIVAKTNGGSMTKSILKFHIEVLQKMYDCIPKNDITFNINFLDLVDSKYELYEKICSFLKINPSDTVYRNWTIIHNKWKELTKICLEKNGFEKEANYFK